MSYVDVLTQSPAKVEKSWLEALRKAGFDDRGIHDICQLTAYFNFVNRMAEGLGIELEETYQGPGESY